MFRDNLEEYIRLMKDYSTISHLMRGKDHVDGIYMLFLLNCTRLYDRSLAPEYKDIIYDIYVDFDTHAGDGLYDDFKQRHASRRTAT